MKNKILKTLFFVGLLCFGINQSNAELITSIYNGYNCNQTSGYTDNASYPYEYIANLNTSKSLYIPCIKASTTNFVILLKNMNNYTQSSQSLNTSSNNVPPCTQYIQYNITGRSKPLRYCTGGFYEALSQTNIGEFRPYFSCNGTDEDLTLGTDNLTLSCEKTTGWVGIIVNYFSELIDTLKNFFDSFNFDFEYTGFNFNISNFYKFLSLNISGSNKPTIYTPTKNSECNQIFTRKMQYFKLDQSGPECYDSSNGSYPNGSFDFVLDFGTNITSWAYIPDSYLGKYTSNTNFVSRDWPSCSEWNTWVMRQDFKYITNYNNNNLININTNIFDSLNIIPINLIVFDVNVTSYINSTAVYILKLTISIFATPIEFINKLYSSFNLFNLEFKDNTNYCFAGGLWRMPSKANTPSVTISNNTNGVNGAGIELFLFLILAFNCYTTFKKLAKQF